MSLAAAILVAAIAFHTDLLGANEPLPSDGGAVRVPATTIREGAPLLFQQQKQSQRNGRDLGFRSHRFLAIEHLEDRRLLAFTHPGLLHTAADFDRMAAKVAEGAEPWTSGWNALTSHGYSQLNADPRPLETVIRGGDGQNFNQMVIDIQRSYMTALRWKVTGDVRYADQTVEFLNAWSSTMTSLNGNADRFLAAGIYGYQWANVAEIMRTYSGWAPADVTKFQNWLLNEYYPLNHQFLTSHNDAAITNYWANWDLCNMAAIEAIGVFCDRQDLYDEALDYFHNGGGNGAADRFVYYVHDGNLGQWQESGRDQGHTVFGVSLVGPFMKMAWNQGDDLFSYGNNRFLAGAEYVAKYNLGEDVPFEQYIWGTGQNGTWQTQTVVSDAGRGNAAPGFELVYNHYVNVMGIAAPYSGERIDQLAPEGSGGGDQLGFGTLTYTLDPIAPGVSKPSGLTARNEGDAVRLNWWGAVYATGYNVYRSTSADGVFTQIASNISDLLTYADYGVTSGEYFYKVAGIIAGGETGFSDVVRISVTPELVVRLPFDETSGVAAADVTGNGNAGTLTGGATWTPGKSGNAVNLSGAGQYVSLPSGVAANLSDFTISTWVYVNNNSNWMRIFDFGDNNGRYMYLTPRNSNGVVRFAIGSNYWYNEQGVNGTAALPTNQWVHVAVTQLDNVLRLYVNGAVVGANAAVSLPPFQLGSVDQNWIGRSQYAADPYFSGKVDDFRVYDGALATGELYQLATSATPPAVPAAPANLNAVPVVGNQINLSWASAGAVTYTLKRGAQQNGPFETIATRLTGTTYADAGLTADVTYYYVVTADNAGGESNPSTPASATALPPLPGVPAGLTAGAISFNKIKLTWTAAANATSYNVKRAAASGGPYATIAAGVTALEYIDQSVVEGATYYYVVTAVNSAAESANSNQAAATATSVRARLKFNETSGAVAPDSSGNGWNGALVNAPQWAVGRIENSVLLDGVDDYVTLPAGVVNGLTDFTIATWVSFDAISNWARVFDFGTGTASHMFLTPKNGANGYLRFAINAGAGEQQINTTKIIPTRSWTHLAVTWTGNVGILYVNGVEAGRNSAMTLNPSSLGSTTQNYIGKSQFADPYLDAKVDDFRILNRAMTAAEISALTYVPPLLGDYDQSGAVDGGDFLAWQRQYGQAASPYAQADGDGSGAIDHPDLEVWSNYYGTPSAASSSSAVPASAALSAAEELAPEPASLTAETPTDAALASLTTDSLDDEALQGLWSLSLTSETTMPRQRAAAESPATAAVRKEARASLRRESPDRLDRPIEQFLLRNVALGVSPIEMDDSLQAAALGSIFSPRLRRVVAPRGTSTGMATDPPAEPGAAKDATWN